MKRQRLTPRVQQRKNNKSLQIQNVQPKVKNKENQQTQRKAGKQNQSSNNAQENTLKICLDLANHHRKEAEQLKVRNQTLQRRLSDQLVDMQNLKKQMTSFKNVLQSNEMIKKDNQQLKIQNLRLKKENQKQVKQLEEQKAKIGQLNKLISKYTQKKESQSILVVGQSKCDNYDINTLTLAKQSRRQQYANNYQSLTFVPSLSCLQCAKKVNQIEQMKQKYCKQLRKLQQQVVELQASQRAIQVMENQMSFKNECIGFLIQQLDNLEKNSSGMLEVMSQLQIKIEKMKTYNSITFDYKSEKLNNSFARSLQ